MKEQVRVLIVDDSATIREYLAALIAEEPGFVVVGQAKDGEEGVRLTQKLRPDVVSMDVNMPVLDGLEAVREIMRVAPTPVVVVTATLDSKETDVAFNAMRSGALAVLQKPPSINDPKFPTARKELLTTLRLMADVKVIHRWGDKRPPRPKTAPLGSLDVSSEDECPVDVIGIASSTGGPGALAEILSRLPADFPLPILIVQHISNNFEGGLVDWLRRESKLTVDIARAGQALEPGHVLIAPSGYHLKISSTKRVVLDSKPGSYVIVPAADVMFNSLAEVYGSRVMSVVLTGMGSDGAIGTRTIRQAGGITMAQDEASCVVYGMPKEAVEIGGAQHVVALRQIARTIVQLLATYA